MAAKIIGQLLAGGAAATATGCDHRTGRELEQAFHQLVFAVYQKHVVIGQARQALLHQGAHVVEAAHLLRQQDQGGWGVVTL